MEFSYDKIANALYLHFSNENPINTEEIADGIIIDYGKEDLIVGIEILNFSRRSLDLNKLIQMSSEEIIPMVVQCQ
jgi:uncharacterized protein YuzE